MAKNKTLPKSPLILTPEPLPLILPQPDPSEVRQQIHHLFSAGYIYQLLTSRPDKYRERILTIEVVFLSIAYFVIDRMKSFADLIDSLKNKEIPGLQEIEVSPQAFNRRIKNLSHSVFFNILQSLSVYLGRTSSRKRDWVAELVPFVSGIYSIDDTTLDKLYRKIYHVKKKLVPENLGGRLGCALDLLTGRFAALLYDKDSSANEKTHIRPLVKMFEAGSLFIFDLGYFSFSLFDELSENYCYFITRMQAKCSIVELKVIADGPLYRDRIVFLGKHASDKTRHPVRLVEFLIKGKWYSYITNVISPELLSASNLFVLYQQRWKIEMSFAVVKRCLGMAYLRTSASNSVMIQIWCTMAVYQVVQELRMEIAERNEWKEDEISWERLMKRIGWYARKERKESLREWLCREAEKLGLRKRGVRNERVELPEEVRKAIREYLPIKVEGDLEQRKPRYRKRPPPKQRAQLVLGRLS